MMFLVFWYVWYHVLSTSKVKHFFHCIHNFIGMILVECSRACIKPPPLPIFYLWRWMNSVAGFMKGPIYSADCSQYVMMQYYFCSLSSSRTKEASKLICCITWVRAFERNERLAKCHQFFCIVYLAYVRRALLYATALPNSSVAWCLSPSSSNTKFLCFPCIVWQTDWMDCPLRPSIPNNLKAPIYVKIGKNHQEMTVFCSSVALNACVPELCNHRGRSNR